MLPFTVEFRHGVPVFEAVVFAVKKAVASGQLVAGDRFPSVRTLSQGLRINPNTAHKVVASLVAQGLLRVEPGIGTVVARAPEAQEEQRAALLGAEVERLVVEARNLGLDVRDVLDAVRRQWKELPWKRSSRPKG